MSTTLTKLQYAEQRMRKQWYDMVMAGESGSSLASLERMYESYVQILNEYLRCYEEYQRETGAIDTHRCA